MPKFKCLVVAIAMLAGGTSSPLVAQLAPAPSNGYTVIRSQYLRLPFPSDIVRMAVGDETIASAELVNNREVLVLGRETGRTTLIIWFGNGVVQSYTLTVQRDLSVLQAALSRINPTIQVESAPDRDALILTGVVPTVAVSQLAETIARDYLAADQSRARAFLAAPQAAVATPPTAPAAAPQAPPPGQAAPAQPASPQPAPPSGATPGLQGPLPPSGTVINLIQLETLPPLPEDKIREAIASLGGGNVTIRRVLKGNVRDDTADTLVLEGRVPNQVALVRVLETAARLFTGQTISTEDLRVVADESGALSGGAAGAQGQTGGAGFGGGGGGGGGGLFGGGGGRALSNQIDRNIARATVVEAGDRILSFIKVADLPQIRVDIRLMEVNRSKLRSFDPRSALLVSSLNRPGDSLINPQGGSVVAPGINKAAVQDVLAFIGGGLLNEFQYVARHVIIDSAFALLEREGIAHGLASPSITVLSGEQAMFLVGGEVPIPLAFSPFFGAVTQQGQNQTTTTGAPFGIFSSVLFESFGVQLSIRPLVGEDDSITLDVQPRVRQPDATLTDQIRQTTGSSLPATAFQTRLLSTSSRLQDGQSLLIGGLTSATSNANRSSTPGVRDVPGVGQLFDNRNTSDNSTELVVLVNPVILRTPVPDVGLWAFPTRDELIRPLLGPGAGSEVPAAVAR